MSQQTLQALDFIRDQITECGEAPTQEEVRHGLFLSSSRHAAELIDQLVEEGRLTRTRASSRNLALPGAIDLTLAGTAAMRAELARRGVGERPLAQRSARPSRACAYGPCDDRVPPGFLMCRPHWLALPLTVRTKLLLLSAKGPEAQYAAAFARATAMLDKASGR